jgi:ATP-binding cassette subfamily B protein
LLNAVRALTQLARREGVRVAEADLSAADARGELSDMTGIRRFFAGYGLAVDGRRPGRRFPEGAGDTPSVALMHDGSARIVLGPSEPSEAGPRVPVVDPAAPGEIQHVAPGDLRQGWTGRIMRFTGSAANARLEAVSGRWFARRLAGMPGTLAALIALSLVAAAANLAPIVYLQIALDRVVGYEVSATLVVLTVAVGLALLVGLFAGRARDRLLGGAAQRVQMEAAAALAARVSAPLQARREAARTGEAAFDSLDRAVRFAYHQVARNGLDLLGLLVFLPLLVFYSPILAGVAGVFLVLAAAVSVWLGARARRVRADARTRAGGRGRLVFQTLRDAGLLARAGHQASRRVEIDRRAADHADAAAASEAAASAASDAVRFLQAGMTVSIIFVGVELVFADRLTAGALIAVNLLAGRALQPVVKAASILPERGEAREAAGRVNEVLAWPQRQRGVGRRPTILGSYRLAGVCPDGDPPAWRLDMTVAPGSRHALVVHTEPAAGLGALFDGAARPAAGTVELDGAPIAQINADHLDRNVARISDPPALISGTAGDNLHGLYPDIDPARIEAYLAALRLDGAAYLPDGPETRIQADGSGIGREAAVRLALVRALIAAPTVIVLDGCLDPLPVARARAVLDDLAGAAGGATVILITGAPSLAGRADRVTVIASDGASSSGAPGSCPALAAEDAA